jgi:hypothetical protein
MTLVAPASTCPFGVKSMAVIVGGRLAAGAGAAVLPDDGDDGEVVVVSVGTSLSEPHDTKNPAETATSVNVRSRIEPPQTETTVQTTAFVLLHTIPKSKT